MVGLDLDVVPGAGSLKSFQEGRFFFHFQFERIDAAQRVKPAGIEAHAQDTKAANV